MQVAPEHPHETQRLESLELLGILDTDPEYAFDSIVRLASSIAGTSIALVSLVDRSRQWFKAKCGIEARETPRDVAFCAHAILNPDEPLIVEDATADPRFRDNPLVTAPPAIRFYAGFPVRDPKNRLPLGTLCVISDEPTKLTQEQKQSLKTLAEQVEIIFSLRLESRKLEKSNQELQRANAAKTEFLRAMSHDIRTPLNGLIGSIELLSDSNLPPEATVYLQTLQACSRSLTCLLDDILISARIETGNIEVYERPIDLKQMCRNVVDVLLPEASAKGVELKCVMPDDFPDFVLTDLAHAHRITLNLASNAVKFTEDGEVLVSLELFDDGFFGICVTDTGPGISGKDLKRIFEPFTQLPASRPIDGSGNGLGLNIVRSLAEALGGTTIVESERGQGSCFTVRLPLQTAGQHSPIQSADCAGKSYNKRALLVDDEPVNLLVIKRMLEKLGISVLTSDCGEAALDIDPSKYDIAFMDCQLPGISGQQATRIWRKAGNQVPVIGVTADVTEETTTECISSGMNEILRKPVTGRILNNCLSRHFSEPSSEA